MWVAGPSAAGTLADWGADVIKIEPPQGDPQRHIFGALGHAVQTGVPPFEIDNRGKRSVVIDLGTADGREQLDRILATADAFITNLRPAALERLSLDHESVLGRFPRLVYGSLTGYGLDGPDRDRAGYDAGAFWARSGMAHTFAPPGELAPALRAGMGDHITGMTLAAGVLAKLLERERTEPGRSRGHEPPARRHVRDRLGLRRPAALRSARAHTGAPPEPNTADQLATSPPTGRASG